MSDGSYVQYGCGWTAPAAWLNFDASPTLRFERLPIVGKLYTRNSARFPQNVKYGDIVKGLPVPPRSCNAVYCSHVLEHLALADFRRALRNTRAIIKAGGVFRLVVPDLEHAVRQYLADPSADAACTLMRDTYLGHEERPRGLKGVILSSLGNSQHLWMWDYKGIEAELTAAGFVGIRRAVCGDAADPMFASVEQPERWEGAVGVECRTTT